MSEQQKNRVLIWINEGICFATYENGMFLPEGRDKWLRSDQVYAWAPIQEVKDFLIEYAS